MGAGRKRIVKVDGIGRYVTIDNRRYYDTSTNQELAWPVDGRVRVRRLMGKLHGYVKVRHTETGQWLNLGKFQ